MRKFVSLSSCLILFLLTQNAKAGFTSWDPEGTFSYTTLPKGYAGSLSQTWENAEWSASETGGSLINWVEGNACVFSVGAGVNTPAYTVTMNSDHTVAGFFDGQQTPNACSVTVTGSGKVHIAGQQGFNLLHTADNANAWLTINNVIADGSSAGQVIMENSGSSGTGTSQIFLNGVNTFTGGVQLGFTGNGWGGIVNYNNNASFGAGAITMFAGGGSALVNEGSSALSLPNNVTVSATGTTNNLNIVPGSGGTTFSGTWSLGGNFIAIGAGATAGWNLTISGPITGSGGSISKWNSGNLFLTGHSTFTGPIIVSNVTGALTIGGSGDLGDSGGTGSYGGAITINGPTGTFTYASSANQTLSGAFTMSGGGTFNQNGSGTLTLGGSGDNASLAATVNGGTLVLGKTSASGAHALGGATTVNNGGTLQLGGSGGYEIYSGVTVTVASGGVFDMNSQSLTAAGITKLNLSGTGIGSGGALINSTTSATSTLTCSSGIALGADSSIGGSGSITLPSVISGSGFGITKIGTGTLTLSGANTYTGGTTVNGGTLYGSGAGSIPGDNVTNTGGTLELGSSTAMSSGATLYLASSPANGAVNLNFSGTQTISAMNWGATSMAQGTWGASGATHNSAVFTGAGLLNITSGGTSQTITFPNPGTQTYGVAPITLTASAPGGAVIYTVTAGPASVTGNQLTITGAGSVTVQANQPGNNTYNAAPPMNATFTVNPLAVDLTGTRAYDGTTTAAAGILSVANKVGSDNVTVDSGNATLASSSVGVEAISSFGTLALGGAQVADYTLTGASGSVTITNPDNPYLITSSYLDVTGTNFVVCWQSVPGVSYYVLTNLNLALPQNWAATGSEVTATNTLTCYTLPGGIVGNSNVFVVIAESTDNAEAVLPPVKLK